MMDPHGGFSADDLAEVEAIFADLAPVDPTARAAVLTERCGARGDLRAEVEALLAAHDRAAGFLDTPGGDDRVHPRTGEVIGQYRLLEKIGEGGMGDVYLAERADGLFTHRVAVKLTRTAVLGGEAIRRFRAERQILASLSHPEIVTLLDGGTTPDGQAYLVMEWVQGLPIVRSCRERALPLDGRLTLFNRVCRAVQYAHQHGIVHRDLKPANILVTPEGAPKVLDFGVAKLLEPQAAGATETGIFPGPLTPNYASPEQLRGLPLTTASDVYALGVLLYELSAGTRPYETAGKTLDQLIDVVVKTEPPRPSAARPADEDAVARRERPRLKGDLDAIVLKAMRKEPEHRYGSAGEIADDLERFLAGQPVLAREPSAAYVLRKLAARNKTATTIAVASLMAIVTALGVALWQRQVAVREHARAEQRLRDVRQLANALIFKIHDAVAPLAGSTPVRRTIVTEALAYLEHLEAESGGDEAIRLELAGAYRQIAGILGDPGRPNLGDRPGALRQYERARALVLPLATRPDATPAAIAALVAVDGQLATILNVSAARDRALPFAQEGFDQAQRLRGRDVPNDRPRNVVARAAFMLAMVQTTDGTAVSAWERARALYEEDLAERPDDPLRQRNVALVEKYLGGTLERAERDEEAEREYRRALALDERRYARDPQNRTVQFDLAIDLANVATRTAQSGRYDEAFDLYARSLALRQALADSDKQDVLLGGRVGYLKMRMAFIERRRGHLDAARALADGAIAILDAVSSTTKDAQSRRDFADALFAKAAIERDLGRTPAACGLLKRGLTVWNSLPRQMRTTYEEWGNRFAASCGVPPSAQETR